MNLLCYILPSTWSGLEPFKKGFAVFKSLLLS
jgi:hypothetical protein